MPRLILISLFATLCVCRSNLAADDRPPNIVLILTDDQGWSQLSEPMDPRVAESHSDYLETPNMTRLARQGNYKLMLFWTGDGKVSDQKLYDLSQDPREENHNIAVTEGLRVKMLTGLLMSYLTSVSAETPSHIRPSAKKKKKK